MDNRNRKIDEVLADLKTGVQAVFESEAYRKWLDALAHFHRYSLNNTILIAMQMPGATQVASFRTWNQLKRKVKSGEHGIRILVPAPVKVKRDEVQEPEESNDRVIMHFKVGHVFDISQTEALPDAPPLSPGVNELVGEITDYDRFMEAVKSVSPVPVRFDEIPGSAKGYYDQHGLEIVIRVGMSPAQTVKTALHELSHAVLHSKDRLKTDGSKDRQTMEVEAESIAHVCMKALLGEDSSPYSFAYIAGWSSGKGTPELMGSLKTIHATASELIDAFEQALKRR